MAIDWKDLIDRMDTLIRTGKGVIVLDELKRLKKTKIPREFIVGMADVSYRVNDPYFGLRILGSIVRGDRKNRQDATDKERAEYAYGLTRISAEEEALAVLKAIDKEKYPRASFYEGMANVGLWNYKASIPHFEKYLQDPSATDYQKIVAEINLAAAYVYECESDNAQKLLEKICVTAEENKLSLVHGKALQLLAENFIHQKNWEEADSALEGAQRLFQITAGLDGFFVKKLVFQKAFECHPDNKEIVDGFLNFREEAIQTKHWESVRDCDRLLAIYTKDLATFHKVFFGTPYASYRERFKNDFRDFTKMPDFYDWNLLGDKSKKPVLDLLLPELGKGKDVIAKESLLHQLLTVLTKDFYRPIRITSIHKILYPGEFFNPQSSPFRVHRAINRLREWFDAQGIPLTVDEEGEFYSLHALSPLTIRVANPEGEKLELPTAVIKLMKHFEDRAFSVSDASKAIGEPVRTLSRVLNQCAKEGMLERTGNARATKFSFKRQKAA